MHIQVTMLHTTILNEQAELVKFEDTPNHRHHL